MDALEKKYPSLKNIGHCYDWNGVHGSFQDWTDKDGTSLCLEDMGATPREYFLLGQMMHKAMSRCAKGKRSLLITPSADECVVNIYFA